jgi:plasmid stabilization system protein ParE
MASIRRSPQAETDLEIILEELQRKNLSVAERYANEFFAKGKALA